MVVVPRVSIFKFWVIKYNYVTTFFDTEGVTARWEALYENKICHMLSLIFKRATCHADLYFTKIELTNFVDINKW